MTARARKTSTTKPPPGGAKFGKYTVKRQLGKGGYGEVYLAGQPGHRNVAIKVLSPTAAKDEDAITRFKREADTAKRLEHPNIVKVLDVGSSRGRYYLVMENVRGGSLRALLDRGAEPAEVLAVLTDVARALAFAHEHGVIHRDVKPANVLLTTNRRAKVADFGLARAVDQSSLTTDGRLLGTASYMSPEQARGGKATPASDVYALGVMIYEAVSGSLPFTAENHIAFLYQHAEVEPARPAVKPPYPTSLGALALECLAKDPAARPTMKQVADRLGAAALRRPRRFTRPLAIAAIAVAALALLTFAVPRVLDPLCGNWFGGGVFRAWRSAASALHRGVFG